MEFERQQDTYEAHYCFQTLKIARDTWFNDQFYTVSFLLDLFFFFLVFRSIYYLDVTDALFHFGTWFTCNSKTEK